MGRTGMTGRGLLGRWGPNHAGDPIVTRYVYVLTNIYIYPHCYASEALSFTHVCTSISSTFGFRSII